MKIVITFLLVRTLSFIWYEPIYRVNERA